jgi:hypothetical protein
MRISVCGRPAGLCGGAAKHDPALSLAITRRSNHTSRLTRRTARSSAKWSGCWAMRCRNSMTSRSWPRCTTRTFKAGSTTTTATSIGRGCVRPCRGSISMSSAGRVVSSNGCVTKPKGRETGLHGWFVRIRSSSLTGSYVMATAEQGSRVNREVHVRFWESLEVKVLWATRHGLPSGLGQRHDRCTPDT